MAKAFLSDISNNNYYTFIGLSDPDNPSAGGNSTWISNEPPTPDNNFTNYYRIFDTIISYSKLSSSDYSAVIRNLTWQANTPYDMYRPNYSASNLTPVTSKANLYDSNYFVINSEYRVYICLNNNAGWNFSTSSYQNYGVSQIEPLFTGTLPQTLPDNYTWKYLYTLTLNDILNLYSPNYIPVPNAWGTPEQTQDLNVYEAAVNGSLTTVVLINPGSDYPVSSTFNVNVRGDGQNAAVQITTDSSGRVATAELTNYGSNYTVAYLDLDYESSIPHVTGTKATFELVISPPGGVGYDLVEDLGANNVIIHSKFENTQDNPFIIQENQFAQIGVIKNPLIFNSSSLFTDISGTGLYGMKLAGFTTETIYSLNTQISQTISTGNTAIGLVVSWDDNTGILKYSQPAGLSTAPSSFNVNRFTSNVGLGGSLAINGQTSGQSLIIDNTFNGNSVVLNNQVIDLGSFYTEGLANPSVSLYRANIVYIDNRPPLSLNPNQREDLKIILEF